jgi:hypothetical protein
MAAKEQVPLPRKEKGKCPTLCSTSRHKTDGVIGQALVHPDHWACKVFVSHLLLITERSANTSAKAQSRWMALVLSSCATAEHKLEWIALIEQSVLTRYPTARTRKRTKYSPTALGFIIMVGKVPSLMTMAQYRVDSARGKRVD